MIMFSQLGEEHDKDNKKPLLKDLVHLINCKFNVTFKCEKSQIHKGRKYVFVNYLLYLRRGMVTNGKQPFRF